MCARYSCTSQSSSLHMHIPACLWKQLQAKADYAKLSLYFTARLPVTKTTGLLAVNTVVHSEWVLSDLDIAVIGLCIFLSDFQQRLCLMKARKL